MTTWDCDECGEPMEPVLGESVSMLGQYRVVTGYQCKNGHRSKP